jgi:hypothetical protein
VWVLDDAITSLTNVAWSALSLTSATNSRISGCPSFRRVTSSTFLHSRDFPEEVGQPFLFVQGYQMSSEFEVEAFRTPAPKICVAAG